MVDIRDLNNINEIMDLILVNAEQMRTDAAMGGEMGDGGASRLEEQVKFYKQGWEGHFPNEWETYRRQYNRENDPEYETYLRLKDKFED